VVNVGLVATNAQSGVVAVGLAASNAVPWLSLTNSVIGIAANIETTLMGRVTVAGETVSIDGNLSMKDRAITAIDYIKFYSFRAADFPAIDSSYRSSVLVSNSIPFFISTNSLVQPFYGPWNFSPSSYWLNADQASYQTNALKLFSGSVTQNQVGARNQARFDGTNLWIGLGGTNWLRFGGVLNEF
jgi:hypothetical protein